MPDERRLVTVLFADVVGSTTLGESLDPEDLRRLLSRFYDIARHTVASHGGTLEKFIGDAAMAIFGLPLAHDDDARRAVDAALQLRDAVQADASLGDRLPIRIGINTGEVVASRDEARADFIVTGDAVNVAARIQQAAEPWQVLASARTASAAGDAHAFGPVVDLDLKGKGSAIPARAVLGRAEPVRRRTPIIGRDADLAQLELVARRAFGERRPYLVSLIAPAGTGKSRLVEEFVVRVVDLAAGVRVAVAQCLPYGQRLTYWPMRALLLNLLDLPADAAPEEIRRRSVEWLTDAGADEPAVTADLLAATIGASETDAVDRPALFSAWRTAVEAAAAGGPLVLLIEDLHWSSESLLDLIEYILQPRGDAPILMLALTRPELLERRPAWGGGRRNHVSMALEPLDAGSIEQLVQHILDGPAPELVPMVVQRSDGNPFYAGEIVRSLIERGIDVRDAAAVATAAAGLPDTVQATVLARLDALDPVARRVLQLGSVLGRGFASSAVSALEPALGAAVEAAIERLVDRDLLRPGGRGELTFRHILIRDVAYGTLPRAERARHHAAAGAWLEEVGAAGREDELAELVAFHYREAAALAAATGETDTEVSAKAVHWLRRAADVAAGARGMAEAAAHLRAAIELAPTAQQPEIYERLGLVHYSGDPSVAAFEAAWRLGESQGHDVDFLLNNLAQQLMVTCRWFASVAHQPSLHEIEELVQRGFGWLPGASDQSRARFLIATSFLPFWLRNAAVRVPTSDDLEQARSRAAEGLAIAERLDDASLMSAALDAMTSHAQNIEPAHARQLSERRLTMSHRISIDERLDALNMIAWTSGLLGDLPPLLRAAEQAIEQIQPGQNFGFALGGVSWHAYACALIGRWDVLVTDVDQLRRHWVEAERPAASYALQGLLSGIDWARNRGDEMATSRWRAVADSILAHYAPEHPVAALRALVELDLEGIARVIVTAARYPDRGHYVEHAMALAADRAHAVPLEAVDSVADEAAERGMRVLLAQARRLRGILRHDAAELAAGLDLFERIGATRYAARVQRELGRLTQEPALLAAGERSLDDLGELDALHRATAG
ncbi:MAG TPA: adenylate/guanylate cyclase domain-containing protein [Candidatus Limnocylindria bacterium]|nr:adenylate/guanylate cyclase domain-containing protein [Candidatus Limnocylindria bacterium]